jgi:hypothetical protein
MTTNIKNWLFAASAAFALSGCAVWTKLDGGVVSHAGVSVNAPADWVQLTANRDVLMITRDGLGVQQISVSFLTGEKIFPKTKQAFSADVAPQELAQRVVGELRQSPEMSGLEIKSVAPATVAGKPGFRALVEWRNERGATFQRVVAGSAIDGGLLMVQYQALKRHFYERDLKVFENVLASAKKA